jgi:hypothetical protein
MVRPGLRGIGGTMFKPRDCFLILVALATWSTVYSIIPLGVHLHVSLSRVLCADQPVILHTHIGYLQNSIISESY